MLPRANSSSVRTPVASTVHEAQRCFRLAIPRETDVHRSSCNHVHILGTMVSRESAPP